MAITTARQAGKVFRFSWGRGGLGIGVGLGFSTLSATEGLQGTVMRKLRTSNLEKTKTRRKRLQIIISTYRL